MQKVISIGKQNFVSLRENDCFYIDKTDPVSYTHLTLPTNLLAYQQ